MKGVGDAKPRGKRVGMSDLIPVMDWPEGEPIRGRLIGPMYSLLNIWFKVKATRPGGKDVVSFSKLCLDHNPETGELDGDNCPYLKSGLGNASQEFWSNFIVRDRQEDSNGKVRKFPTPKGEPTTKGGYKAYWGTKEDANRTPVRAIQIPESKIAELQAMMKTNRVKTENGVKVFEPNDIKYGFDIEIMIDKAKKGPSKYIIVKADRTPLTPEERRYIIFPLDLVKPDSLSVAKQEMKDIATRVVDDKGKPVSNKRRDDDEDEHPRRGKGRDKDIDDEELDDEDQVDLSDEDLDEEDDKPARKSGKSKPASRKSRDDEDEDEDEDIDDSVDEDDEDEDEQPRKGKKSGKSRRSDDDEDELDNLDDELGDLDSDEDDSGDDEDERPSRGKSKPSRRSRDDDEDEGDDDEGDDEGEEEDERPARRSSKPAARSRRR
jgi:hypothetical protein